MKYVAYYRVSTQEQGASGLGLESQQSTVLSYIKFNGNKIVGEYTEIESGKNDMRPELLKAIQSCKDNDAVLVIAKLDRLSRNLTFISTLMDNRVRFICCDMPEANELTIGLMAVLAQWERKTISERTKKALDAKRLREPDWKPGTNNLTDDLRKKAHASTRLKARTDPSVRHAYHFIKPMRENGISFQKIAVELNKEGYKTRTGLNFHAMTVRNIWKRFETK
jgi:DNA invertase Pin-like site-specific DNA recombinase